MLRYFSHTPTFIIEPTLLRREGVPMEDIQKWLGHSQITITNKLYAHFEYGAHLKSAEKIGKALEM